MSQPAVCAVMLTADRPELAKRAVECFRAQTYPAKGLWILDTSRSHCVGPRGGSLGAGIFLDTAIPMRPITIGELRNNASKNSIAEWSPDILIHWDDDDYSHPDRIAEQVALLQSSGADAVGYREMLFWRETPQAIKDQYAEVQRRYPTDPNVPIPAHLRLCLGEAWLYSSPDPRAILGTSLCYWRTTWERKPFEPTSQGEDFRFTAGLNCVGIRGFGFDEPPGGTHCQGKDVAPRMVARIHTGNTSNGYGPEQMRRQAEWKRAREWDSYARSIMEGK